MSSNSFLVFLDGEWLSAAERAADIALLTIPRIVEKRLEERELRPEIMPSIMELPTVVISPGSGAVVLLTVILRFSRMERVLPLICSYFSTNRLTASSAAFSVFSTMVWAIESTVDSNSGFLAFMPSLIPVGIPWPISSITCDGEWLSSTFRTVSTTVCPSAADALSTCPAFSLMPVESPSAASLPAVSRVMPTFEKAVSTACRNGVKSTFEALVIS